ncbi:MAG: Tma20 N-terminal domain-containing protein, partial [Methanosarcinaceae archaeon]|nr:Tma20 N-terminal domain-containing protein [Methanosarcinaceae archaeon]
MKIRSRVQLRKSVKNKLMDELTTTFGDIIKELKDSKFETALIDTFNVILIDGKLLLFSTNGEYFPTVRGAIELGLAKHIV